MKHRGRGTRAVLAAVRDPGVRPRDPLGREPCSDSTMGMSGIAPTDALSRGYEGAGCWPRSSVGPITEQGGLAC